MHQKEKDRSKNRLCKQALRKDQGRSRGREGERKGRDGMGWERKGRERRGGIGKWRGNEKI